MVRETTTNEKELHQDNNKIAKSYKSASIPWLFFFHVYQVHCYSMPWTNKIHTHRSQRGLMRAIFCIAKNSSCVLYRGSNNNNIWRRKKTTDFQPNAYNTLLIGGIRESECGIYTNGYAVWMCAHDRQIGYSGLTRTMTGDNKRGVRAIEAN